MSEDPESSVERLRRFNPTVPEGHYYAGYVTLDMPRLYRAAEAWLVESGVQHPHLHEPRLTPLEHVELLVVRGELDHAEWVRRGCEALGQEPWDGLGAPPLWSSLGIDLARVRDGVRKGGRRRR